MTKSIGQSPTTSEILRHARILSNPKKRFYMRSYAATELGRAGHHPVALDALLAAMADPSLEPHATASCVRSLAPYMAWEKVSRAVLAAVDHTTSGVRQAAIESLGAHAWISRLTLIRLAEKDEDSQVRLAAVRALAPEGEKDEVLDLFVAASGDLDAEVREAAALAMLRWVGQKQGLATPLGEVAKKRGALHDRSLAKHIRKVLEQL